MANQMLFNSTTPTLPVPLRPLCPGDTISIVAPSSPFDGDEFLKASHLFQSRGYRLKAGRHVFQRDGYLAGPDSGRSEDLMEALTDPETTAVLCVRGGYGSARILDWLPFSILAQPPKIFMGYSDVTFLHAAFHSRLNRISFHGPNLLDFFSKMEASERETAFQSLEGKRPFSWTLDECQVLRHGRACGRIMGGNLTCLTHLLGSSYFPDPGGALLLLEDRGEAPYRVDRAFAHLKLAGILERIGALLLGSFEDCGAQEEVLERILEHLHPYRFPVVCGLPFGHGPRNDILPLGLPFLLDTRGAILESRESPFRPTGTEKPGGRLREGAPGDGRSVPVQRPPLRSREGHDPLEMLLQEALRNRTFSCGSLLVADSTRVLLQQTWGLRQYGGEPCDESTLFDLASLTKPLLVAPLMMHAVGVGLVDLEDPLTRFFPNSLMGAGHRHITVGQLLNHASGLPPYEPYYRNLIAMPPHERKEALLQHILKAPLESPPGNTCRYSDLGFLLLGILLENVWERPLEDLAETFFAACERSALEGTPEGSAELPSLLEARRTGNPAGGTSAGMGYHPLATAMDPTVPPTRFLESRFSFAATEYCPWRRRLLEGEVHDENAYCLDGVAGHAGLFGSTYHVWSVLAFLWGIFAGKTEREGWSREVVKCFWTRDSTSSEGSWALGYDTPSPGFSSAGSFFSPRSVGHLGFTGTSFWLDPDAERLVVFLSNRVHPSRENWRIRVFRPLLHNLVMEMLHEG